MGKRRSLHSGVYVAIYIKGMTVMCNVIKLTLYNS